MEEGEGMEGALFATGDEAGMWGLHAFYRDGSPDLLSSEDTATMRQPNRTMSPSVRNSESEGQTYTQSVVHPASGGDKGAVAELVCDYASTRDVDAAPLLALIQRSNPAWTTMEECAIAALDILATQVDNARMQEMASLLINVLTM